MISLKRAIIVIVCFFVMHLAGSEKLLCEKHFKGVQKVEFKPLDRGHHKITNIILQKISEANNALRVFTGFEINYEIGAKLVEEKGLVKLNLYLNDIRLDGDVYYRDFKIDNIITPTHVNIDLILENQNQDHYYLVEINAEIPEVDKTKTLLYSKPIEKSAINKNDITISLTGMLFYYDNKALENFKIWEEALFSYYESSEKLDVIEQNLESLNLDSSDRLILDEFHFCEAETLFWSIYHAPFRYIDNFYVTDPKGLKSRLQPLKDSIVYYRDWFNESISRLDESHYTEGLKYIEENNLEAALEKFKKAVIYNPAHIYSYLRIIDVYLVNEDIDTAAEIVVKVLDELHPVGEYRDSTLSCSRNVFDNYFFLIDSLNYEGRYTEAIEIVEKTIKLNDAIDVLDYTEDIDGKLIDVHTGMYESFLEVINRATTAISHSYALTYIDHAIEYKQKNNDYVRNDGRVYDYLQQIYDRLIATGRQMYIMRDFSGAESMFYDALQICDKYSSMKCKDEVVEYFALAQKERKQAEIIAVEVIIKEPLPKMRDEEVIEQVREEMLKTLSHGHLRAWATDMDEAYRVLENMTEKSALYGLRNDSLVNARLVSLSKRIREKECELAQRQFYDYFEEFNRMADMGEYIKAENELVKAKNLHEKYDECKLNIDSINKKLEKIKPAVEYQHKMAEVRNLFFSQQQSDWELFVKKYSAIDSYYQINHIEEFGVKHKTLYEFINNSTDQSLVLYGVTYFSEKAEPLKALELLKRLKKMGVEPERTQGVQEYAGKVAAQFYATNSPESSSREILRELTDFDRWLRTYNRAFLRNW